MNKMLTTYSYNNLRQPIYTAYTSYMLTMNSKTRNDLDRQIKELNERTKGGYAVGYAYGKCVLETKDGFNTFGFDRMTKTQLYNALYMLNKVLANEEYRDKKEIEA